MNFSDLESFDGLQSFLTNAGVSYKATEKLSDNSLGLPLWISQTDFDAQVAALPQFAQLLGEQIQIDTTGEIVDTTVMAVLETPTSTANLADVVTWLNRSGIQFSVQQFVLDPAGTLTMSASDWNLAIAKDAALQAFLDAGRVILEADQTSQDAGNAVVADSGSTSDTGSTSSDQGTGDGTQGGQTTDPAADGGSTGGADAGSTPAPVSPDGQPAGGTAAGDDSAAGTGDTPPDTGDASSSDAGTQDSGSTGSVPPAAPVTPTPTPVVVPSNSPGGNTGRAATDSSINQIVWSLIKDLSSESKAILEDIYTYIGRMLPGKPLTKEEGVRNHLQLFSALKRLFNSPDVDLQKTMPAVLKLFEAHTEGVFGERYRFRFVEAARGMTGEERYAYQHIVHMLITLAPVRGRQQALSQIDLKKSLGNPKIVKESGLQKVTAFFNVR